MSRPLATATRPQLALQSYLDALLQEASVELAESISREEFEAAVLEEQVRDARLTHVLEAAPAPLATPIPVAPELEVEPLLVLEPEVLVPAEVVTAPELAQARVEPLVELGMPGALHSDVPALVAGGRPAWGEEPFECLLFDVAGLTLAVPLVSLGSIYPLAGQELTPLFGQPDWFLGILPCQAGNLKVLDTARWVMPERYRDDFREGLQYVISVQGYEWGLAVHQVSRSIRLDPNEIKWRSQRSQRPWLAGTVIEHMCALLDVSALAELIASGAIKRMSLN
ncbi:CheW domain-containing protein [Pseudomonas sp. JS3066]|uniref:CheW domain-containing protein n=1 Tax=unclassified Pseudomonas TaxID=196821 RepID=UPI000EAAA89C|nr:MULTISPECIES: CheW domain-containing protein [unclassified Pseudomonas]AYF85923.1 chemotaxis protein CheW [Pseudomonas sp. DY-1]MDH4656317.1 CheW domain-containing protein [Pseudomonas sp. BN606]MRK19591.1 CheW domain-containing protein [Pseudomonas sp. JG-B]WVK91489.1 CheW domain-containing protein [Pseudomonas sp. JS3066]